MEGCKATPEINPAGHLEDVEVISIDGSEEENDPENMEEIDVGREDEDLQSEKVETPPPCGDVSTTNMLQDLTGLIEWIYKGTPRRDQSRGMTFMEKKVTEMEKNLEEKDCEISELKAEVTRLMGANEEVENSKQLYKKAFQKERLEKTELLQKLHCIKGATSQIDTVLDEVDQLKQLDVAPPKLIDQRKCLGFQLTFTDIEAVEGGSSKGSSSMALVPYKSPAPPQPDPDAIASRKENYQSSADALIEGFIGSEFKNQPNGETGSKSVMPGNTGKLHHGRDERKSGNTCLCGLKFANSRTLSSHIVYFTSKKFFSCGICGQSFVGTNYLKGHMWRSHKVRYTGGVNGCRDCGRTFASLGLLRLHKREDHDSSESRAKDSKAFIPKIRPLQANNRASPLEPSKLLPSTSTTDKAISRKTPYATRYLNRKFRKGVPIKPQPDY